MGGYSVQEFMVRFHSFRDIQDFVSLASAQPHNLIVGSDRFQVNATSFMGMFALNCRKPQKVCVNCTEEELQLLLTVFHRFLAP